MAKFGQIVLFGKEQKKLGFVKKNQTWYVGYDVESKKFIKFKGHFTETDETSDETMIEWAKRQNAKEENHFAEMTVGQAFMFKGDKYYFVKSKRTNAEITDGKGGSWNLRLSATITPLDEIKLFCKYCNKGTVDHEDLLCDDCREVFGHSRYSEL